MTVWDTMVSLIKFSVIIIDKTVGRNPRKRDITGGELWKPTRPLNLILKTVSDQPHTANNVGYGLP